jgi:hypothetical protein
MHHSEFLSFTFFVPLYHIRPVACIGAVTACVVGTHCSSPAGLLAIHLHVHSP